MTLPEPPFLEVEENQFFCQKAFTFLQSREHKSQIHGDNYLEQGKIYTVVKGNGRKGESDS